MEAAQGLAVAALLGMLAAAAWLLRRGRLGVALGSPRRRGPAELVQRLPLTAQHCLHLVRCGGETLWVVTYPNGAVIDRSRSFGDWLARAEDEMPKEAR